MTDSGNKVPLLLMVSGGSDSIAMLEIAHAFVQDGSREGDDEMVDRFFEEFGDPSACRLSVLHVNHMLRGEDSDADERFALDRCAELGIPCESVRVDVATLANQAKGGVEAVARKERYKAADVALNRMMEELGTERGFLCTAHTLDDRIETFFMRALVGTGPSGLASIPRERGNLRRPLLDASREQLRNWLRDHHPGRADSELWREDKTNYNGENFRSQVRMELMPVLRELRPGFEQALAQTMDLMAEEELDLKQQADSIVYRSLAWDGATAALPTSALSSLSRPMARRVLRTCLLVANPDARLEAKQIDRVLDHLNTPGFATDVSGGLRVSVDEERVQIIELGEMREK